MNAMGPEPTDGRIGHPHDGISAAAGSTGIELLRRTQNRVHVAFLALVVLLAHSTDWCHAATVMPLKLKEVVLAKAEPGAVPASVVVSSDFRRVAYVVIQRGKQHVFVDGKRAATLDGVGFGTPALSPDGKRLLFIGIRGINSFVSVDGIEGKPFESIDRAEFSPDGKRVLFVAQRGGRFFVVINDVEGPAFDQIGEGDPQFSEGGDHVAYAARRDGKWQLMVDDKPGPSFEAVGRGTRYFSADGKTLAYLAVRRGKYFVIVEGVEGKEYDAISDLIVADGGRVAYRAVSGKEQRVVLSGKEGPLCEAIITGSLAFSKGGARFGYVEKKGDLVNLVLDGVAGAGMRAVGPPVFGPANNRVAHKAERDLDTVVVLDDKEGPPFLGISADGPIFSPDGSRLVYSAQRGVSWVAVTDGVPGRAYDGIGLRSMAFSADSKHLAYWAKRGIRSVLVVDGSESPEYRSYVGTQPPKWDSTGTVSGLVLKDEEFVRIEAEAPQK